MAKLRKIDMNKYKYLLIEYGENINPNKKLYSIQ